ncbi:MAG: hypothetical protein IJ979_00520, partial [Tidjanibacter sp.]|nr:hypothetical protein [Tidjanibacter sp.]
VTIILIGTIVTLMFIFISPSKYGSDFWAGILSGALTTTPGYSAAQGKFSRYIRKSCAPYQQGFPLRWQQRNRRLLAGASVDK